MRQTRLHELFNYKPDGFLVWVKPTANCLKTGDRSGSLTQAGYYRASVDGKRHYLHRLIWIWHNGSIPAGYQVDHINGVKSDNRIENLQLLTNRQNVAKGKKACKDNALPTGVFKRQVNGRFWSAIVDGSKRRYLGSFATAEQASKAYENALEQLR